MIVLDTTVLVYAAGVDHPLKEPCRRLIAAVADGAVAATTTVEVLQELAHVCARRRGRDDAAALGAAYATLLSPLLPVGSDDLDEGLRLFRAVPSLGAFDCVLAATALRRSATALVSADAAFAGVPGLVAVQPDAAGVERLL